MRHLTLIMSVTVCGTTAIGHAAAFTNGSFEMPAITTDTDFTRLDNTTFGSWTAVVPTGSDVAVINGSRLGTAAQSGVQFYNFNGGDRLSGSTLYQDFDTVVGRNYTTSFYVGRLGGGSDAVSLQARAIANPTAATPLLLATLNAPGLTPTYTQYAFNFSATSTVTRLSFVDTTPTGIAVDVTLDNVTVVPEPSVMALGGAGALLLRRRRPR